MDKITFGFKKDEYFFKMKTLPFWCEREYGIEVDGYLGQIYNIIGCDCGPNVILDKEIKIYERKASVIFKNLMLRGRVESRSKWGVFLNDEYVASLEAGKLRIKDIEYVKTPLGEQQNKIYCREEVPIEEKENFYKLSIERYSDLYSKIVNKEDFKKRFLDDVDWELYYELTERKFLNEVSDCFDTYLFLESLNEENAIQLITALDDARVDLVSLVADIKSSYIFQSVEDLIRYSIPEMIEDYLYDLEHSEERVELKKPERFKLKDFDAETLFPKLKNLVIKEIFFREVGGWAYRSMDAMLKHGEEVLNKCLEYEKVVGRYISSFGDKEKIVDLSKEKEKKFTDYENNVVELTENEKKEYDFVFKFLMPYFEPFALTKTRKFRPIFVKLPMFIDYVKKVIEVLLQNEIIEEQGERFVYKGNDNIKSVYCELQKLV